MQILEICRNLRQTQLGTESLDMQRLAVPANHPIHTEPKFENHRVAVQSRTGSERQILSDDRNKQPPSVHPPVRDEQPEEHSDGLVRVGVSGLVPHPQLLHNIRHGAEVPILAQHERPRDRGRGRQRGGLLRGGRDREYVHSAAQDAAGVHRGVPAGKIQDPQLHHEEVRGQRDRGQREGRGEGERDHEPGRAAGFRLAAHPAAAERAAAEPDDARRVQFARAEQPESGQREELAGQRGQSAERYQQVAGKGVLRCEHRQSHRFPAAAEG